MEPSDMLLESARRIAALVNLAVAPARIEAARLAVEAEPVKARRISSRAVLASTAASVGRFGWIPIFGAHLRARHLAANATHDASSRAWAAIRARARSAADAIASARAAREDVARAEARARQGGAMPDWLELKVEELRTRAIFLAETDARDGSRLARMMPKLLALANDAAAIASAWDGRRPEPSQVSDARRQPPPPTRAEHAATVAYGRGAGRKVQLGLDFTGAGQDDGLRIWLPVSASRSREMVERGARVDKEASRRGSQLWVPVADRHAFEPFLPLAFRSLPTKMSFPPIRHNAAGQNLWSVFDKDSWNHIRTTAYDRSGHRCQVCGKQGGSLWSRIAQPEERSKGGPVDCHEVWDWNVTDPSNGVGIQKLTKLLVLCKDCHLAHHEGFAIGKAREAGIGTEAEDYLRSLRMLMNRCDGATLDAQLAGDRAAWDSAKGVQTWILDLSHLAAQDFMSDQTLVLRDSNRAGIDASQIGGIAFQTEGGTSFAASSAEDLARGEPARPLTARRQSRI